MQMKDPYLIIHYFRFCRIGLDGKKLRYCINDNLIYAINQIGFYKAPNEKKSAYKRGINYICNTYKLMFNETLYKTEVRRLARPNLKREHCLYFPQKTLKILDCIVSCIDVPEDGTIHNKCVNARQCFCEEQHRPNLHCYFFLVFDLITHLRALEGQMDHRSKAYDIFRKLEKHPKKCKK